MAKTHIFRLADNADDRAVGGFLARTVRVTVAVSDVEHESTDQLVATAVEPIEPPETSDYYTWDLEKALSGVEPIQSLSDLAIPGLKGVEFDAFWEAVNERVRIQKQLSSIRASSQRASTSLQANTLICTTPMCEIGDS